MCDTINLKPSLRSCLDSVTSAWPWYSSPGTVSIFRNVQSLVSCCCFFVQSLSHVWPLVTPWTAACQVSLSFTISWNLLKLMSIESVIPSNHLILCRPIRFSSSLQSFPAWGSFPMSQFFASGSQNIGVSASASVLLMNIQSWFPLGPTGLISFQSKGLLSVFSNITVQKHQFFGTQRSLRSNSHILTWLLEKA